MAQIYNTGSQPGRKAFQFWHGLMCRNFAPAHGSAADEDAFDAHFTVSELGDATVCQVSAPMQFWDRSRHHVQRAPKDDFLLTELVSGKGTLRQDGHETTLRPGAMAIYDTSRPYSYEVGGDVIFVKLPRGSLLPHLQETPALALGLDSTSDLGKLVSGILRQTASLGTPTSSPCADLVGASVVRLIAALLRSPTSATAIPAPGVGASQLDNVMSYVRAHLEDPELSLASIAQSQRVSARTLHRLFTGLGTTPMRWVLQERLAHGLRALQQKSARRVTDIAFECGFSDLSHFSRMFRKEFGRSPHEIQPVRNPLRST